MLGTCVMSRLVMLGMEFVSLQSVLITSGKHGCFRLVNVKDMHPGPCFVQMLVFLFWMQDQEAFDRWK